MIVEDEGDGVGQTHNFEAPGEQVVIPKDQDAAHAYELSADASESSKSAGAHAATQ